MNAQSNEVLLRLKDVKARTGLSKTTLYRLMKEGTFPANVQIGARSAAWVGSEVQRWIDNKVAAARR